MSQMMQFYSPHVNILGLDLSLHQIILKNMKLTKLLTLTLVAMAINTLCVGKATDQKMTYGCLVIYSKTAKHLINGLNLVTMDQALHNTFRFGFNFSRTV